MGQTTKRKFTEFQQFAIDLMKEKGEINPSYFAQEWATSKGRGRAASRDMFGYISCAYQCLRKLAEEGIVNKILTKYSGGYTGETFTLK